jgi:hypothetical protein
VRRNPMLDAMPKIRDFELGKLSPADVGGVIGFVEQLLLTKSS